jgi:uncharacterized membrane protein YccC
LIRLKRHAPIAVRWAARRLELRSFGLVPEHYDPAGGLRAAVATGVPLAAMIATAQPGLAWAVFAAFWTCLCDVPGPDRLRRRLLAMFVGGGALVVFVGSWAASIAPAANMVFGPLLVFGCVLGAARIAHGGTLGTLLAVAGVVAVGFPHGLAGAAGQATAYLVGAAWAWLLINLMWRTNPDLPLIRAREAVCIRLLDMADSLSRLGQGPHRDERWHSEHAEHRRAVRLAIERLRGLLERYPSETTGAFDAARDAGESLFSALIALDQAFIDHAGPDKERLAVARAARMALLAWYQAQDHALHRAASRLRRLRARLKDSLCIGCTLGFEDALDRLGSVLPVAPRPTPILRDTIPAHARQQAMRQTAGLVAVYYAAMVFQLGYPYWASMAVVVVLQGGARVTWTRGLERILGSLVGGAVTFGLLHWVDSPPPLAVLATILAAAAIALRSVNYTLFVIFLTMLFVIVTEMLHPGAGIASARVLDNTIGTLAALLAVFVFWPDFGASPTTRIEAGIAANRAYYAAVAARKPFAEIETARRRAGLASIEAEVALHDLSGLLRRLSLPESGETALKDLRTIAGQAAVEWHRRKARLIR